MQQNSMKLAYNSVALFIRMLLRLVISIYTMRVILKVLGVEDYGVYNVVAGFTVMFGFLNSTMSSSISRFVAYNIGIGASPTQMRLTFKIALTIQLGIILFILLFAETVGLWFVNHQLVIPSDRMFAANVIYQASIISMLFTVIQVPYNASIIAHENMNIYAYIEVGHSLLLLLIAYLLTSITHYDRLVVYGLLMVLVYAFTSCFYWLYCRITYSECRYGLTFKWARIRTVLSFSGWDLFANIGLSFHSQGINVILNVFWNTVLNAAAGVANQIYAALLMFTSSVTTAIRPQIIKSYASKDYSRTGRLFDVGSRFLYLSTFMMSIPIIIKMDAILALWLVDVPDYSIQFARIILISQCIFASKSLFPIMIHATGRIAKYSILTGCIYIFAIPFAYFLAKVGCNPSLVYASILIILAIYMYSSLFFIHRYFPQYSIKQYFVQVFLYSMIVFVIGSFVGWGLERYFTDGILGIISFSGVSALFVGIMGYYLILSKEARSILKNFCLQIFRRYL